MTVDSHGRIRLLEKDVQKTIMDRLAADGYTVFKLDVGVDKMSGRHYGAKGMADLIALKGDRFRLIEIKRPGKKPQTHQEQWHEEMRRRGHPVEWYDGYDTGQRPFIGQDGR